MTKLTAKPVIRDRSEKRKESITTIKKDNNVTTSTGPTPFRLTPHDKIEMTHWIDELQELTNKKLTPAKLLRGLIEMRGKIPNDLLISAIKEVT